MLPPNDSLQHQYLKAAEFISTTHPAQVPPPAYSATGPVAPALIEDQLAEDDQDYDYLFSRPPPITININASLKIEGHGNTIMLPPSPMPPTSPSSSSRPSAGPEASQRAAQNGCVEKLTGMVLAALKDAGLLGSTNELDGQSMSRPIDIHVDASILLKGSKNTVCSGLPKWIKGTGDAAAKVKPGPGRADECAASEGRKRRACSVTTLSHWWAMVERTELTLILGAS